MVLSKIYFKLISKRDKNEFQQKILTNCPFIKLY
ncbi:hypothetical protein BOM_0878 (plasmid) [Borrelia miyamotoi FR64b]|nr:hypothetical protein BOM_0878 [Borrelia miyamotoi FR64b]